MRVALAQLTSGPRPEDNLALVEEWTARAAEAGASLVVFPEATMAWFAADPATTAEETDGPWAAEVAAIARRHQLTVAVGMFTRAEDPSTGSGGRSAKVRNTLLLTDGTAHHRYHKIHLFDAFGHRESDTVSPGTQTLQLTLGTWPTGVAICYDLRFGELFTGYADAGAELLLVSASWGAGAGKLEQWRTLSTARALDTTCWVIACDQAEPQGEQVGTAPLGVGHSMVVDPLGRIVAEAGAGPELLVVDLDHDLVGQARRALPVLDNAALR
ncbi:MAG TPA: carbon-nitrogen hydrolase family protein [Candidatus Avipropionibacterium avicola]|uniref:Carbon-nitrogen hydrolase family protein n=1 Tax=Candidatus Avipropionibacterium avicola TaxID=2840701 RepID=A0A9D1GXM0_9ACTN|nr:carbon-nitrogen hydrolase family protein [Candidatus Avipropionibacterium avicola]